jgi:hypothetical protein
MKSSLKGALLSGLVLPGLGQLWLKQYAKGAALIIAVSAAMALIVAKAARHALTILEQAEATGTVDMVAIVNSASRASARPDDWQTTVAMAVLVICWVAGVVDAYLAGKKLDRQQRQQRDDR